MMIDLPFPAKALWPNGRAHWGAKSTATAKHRAWAAIATREVMDRFGLGVGPAPIPVTIHVYPKPRGPEPDADNCVAAAKSSLDGIADALGINDRDFAAPKVVFGPREGRFVIEVG